MRLLSNTGGEVSFSTHINVAQTFFVDPLLWGRVWTSAPPAAVQPLIVRSDGSAHLTAAAVDIRNAVLEIHKLALTASEIQIAGSRVELGESAVHPPRHLATSITSWSL